MSNFKNGDRVIFRINTDGPPELGTVEHELPPTDTHPNGGEFLVSMDDGTPCIAWIDELSLEGS